MQKQLDKDVLCLAVAGLVFVTPNVWLLWASKGGTLAPIGDLSLWGVSVVLNMAALLVAARMLGFLPLVAAAAYVAGGCLAYQGVHLLQGVDVVQASSAGATYGALGALAVGKATAKVRFTFVRNASFPFVAAIVPLTLLDGILNSRLMHASSHLMLSTVAFPLLLAGGIAGLVGIVIERMGIGKPGVSVEAALQTTVAPAEKAEVRPAKTEPVRPAIQKTTPAVASAGTKPAVAAKPVAAPAPKAAPVTNRVEEKKTTPEVGSAPVESAPKRVEEKKPVAVENPAGEPAPKIIFDKEHLSTIKIGEDNEFILPADTPELMKLAAISAAETGNKGVQGSASHKPASKPVPAEAPAIPQPASSDKPEAVKSTAAQKPGTSDDWLSSHMELLNKLKK